MEPRGCKRWQSVANRRIAETAKEAKSVATGYDRLPEKFHGKEGVCRGLRQFQKRGSARRGRAGTARLPYAHVRRQFVKVEIAAALGPTAQAKEVERANEPRSAITPAGT